MKRAGMALAGLVLGTACATTSGSSATQPPRQVVEEQSRARVPTPPWPAGDLRGMGNTQGPGTWLRCAWYLNAPNAKLYDLAQVQSNGIPMVPLSPPLEYEYDPTVGVPGTSHAVNRERPRRGDPGSHGTQIDAFGHMGYLSEPWTGQGPFPTDKVRYFGGLTQAEVKPTPDSPLLKLGVETIPPIITSAVLLDAHGYLGKGEPMKPGQQITPADIEGMMKAQGIAERGLLPGDVLYIYTGWEKNWATDGSGRRYVMMGPGLSFEAAKYLRSKAIVAVGIDNPYVDPAPEGLLEFKAPPAEGMPPGIAFGVHYYNLTQAGIHQVENARLSELVADKVWTSCTLILPQPVKGGSGSVVRPVAIGVPGAP
jgi:kynurenine formamidase